MAGHTGGSRQREGGETGGGGDFENSFPGKTSTEGKLGRSGAPKVRSNKGKGSRGEESTEPKHRTPLSLT